MFMGVDNDVTQLRRKYKDLLLSDCQEIFSHPGG